MEIDDMTIDEAKTCLDDSTQKPSKHGEATDILYQKYRSYKRIASEVKQGADFLSKVHAVFKLPKGIQWQINEKKISTSQARQIYNLKNEEDKWLFALAIVENNLKDNECESIIKHIKGGTSINEALRIISGISFSETKPLILMIQSEFWMPITKRAWEQKREWADIGHQLVCEGLEVNIQDIATQLKAITAKINNSTDGRK